MGVPLGSNAGTGDMFLKVTGAKHGPIKGETQDEKHKEEIEVLRWTWGITGQYSGPQATGKSKMHDLKIFKRIDRASTALMQAMRENEEIKEAILTVRKAGESPLEFLKVKIRRGRITAFTVEAGDLGGGSELLEQISFAFNEIEVEYTAQGKDGRSLGTSTFIDTWSEHF